MRRADVLAAVRSATPVSPRRSSSSAQRHARPARRRANRPCWADSCQLGEFGFELRADLAAHLVDVARPSRRLRLTRSFEYMSDTRGMRLDALVHQRLRERRLVGFVVAEAAIAEHVDDDGLLEASAGTRSRPWRRARRPRDQSPFTWKIGAWIIKATSEQ